MGDGRQELVLHAAGSFALVPRILRLARLLLGHPARDAELGEERDEQQRLKNEEREVRSRRGIRPSDIRIARRTNKRASERRHECRTRARQPRRGHHGRCQQQEEGAIVNQLRK